MKIIYTIAIALFFTTLHLSAEVEVTDLSSPKVLDQPGEQISLDIDGNGESDFLFYYDLYLGEPYLHVNLPSNAGFTSKVVVTGLKNKYNKDLVAAIVEGTSIGPGLKYNGSFLGNGPLVAQPSSAGPDILEGRGEVYVGIRFAGVAGNNYGWIALEVNGAGNVATIRAYAWETEVDTPIDAGAGRAVPVESIEVHPQEGTDAIDTPGGTLHMLADINPSNATETGVTWSVDDPTVATIDTSGLLTAKENGMVTVTARAVDGSNVEGELLITVTNQSVPVTSIIVEGVGGVQSISEKNGTLQLNAEVFPENASNADVVWSLEPTGLATIDQSGLLTAEKNGEVTVTATAADGSGVSGSLTVFITGQGVAVTSITVRSQSGATEITEDMGTLQMVAEVAPANATEKSVTWSVEPEADATISQTGVLTAIRNGQVTVTATAVDGSGVSGTTTIDLSGQSTMSVEDETGTAESLNLQ